MLTTKADRQARRKFFIALLSAFVALLPALAQQQQNESPVSPAHPIAGAPQTEPPMGMSMGLVAPLVIESGDWTSVLTLVNESKNPVHAQIVLHIADDMMSNAPSQTVELPGHSSRRVAVASLLNGAAPDFIGSLTASIQEPEAAKNMAVAAQLTLTGQGALTGTSVDEELEMPKMGSNFKSVVDGSSSLLAIQNSGMDTAAAMVTCIAHRATTQTIVQIPADGLRLLRGCDLLDGDLTSAAHVFSGIMVSNPDSGHGNSLDEASAYQVSAGSSELSVFGLSASFEREDHLRVSAAMFVNQSEFTSQSTVFAGIPVGTYNALPGTAFVPKLMLANLSNTSHTAIVRGALNDAATPPKVLATITLQPFEVKRTDVSFDASSALGSVIVDQDGVPGDVISTLTDLDKADQTALVPRPKFLHHANNGGGHPWSIESGTSSTLVIFNASSKLQTLNFNLGADGIAWKKTVTIQANETLSMDVKNIIAQANEESSKSKSKPKPQKITALTGEISWFTPGQADVFSRVLIARDQNGRKALESYSCGYNIVMCGSFLDVTSATFAVGATGSLGPIEALTCTAYDPKACSGQSYGPGGGGYLYNWSALNPSIADISGSNLNPSGTYLGKSPGTGTGQGNIANGTGCSFVSDGTLNVILVSINSASLTSNRISTTLGPSGLSGPFSLWESNGSSDNYSQNAVNRGAGGYTDGFNLTTSTPTGQYSKIYASWSVAGAQIITSSNFSFYNYGNTRHSQYTLINEGSCSGGTSQAYVITNQAACFSSGLLNTNLNTLFESQTALNGSGRSRSYGLLKARAASSCKSATAGKPNGATNQNTFVEVSTITGACNVSLSTSTVAQYQRSCGKSIFLLGFGNPGTVKTVQDECRACGNDAPHFDDWNPGGGHSCGFTLGDLGHFVTEQVQQ
ncbi:MAG: hypothetical protein M3Y72_05715 [Acidobacteriota bacterium]|nr:hypothetical protein [Acidobacteriota bacterium]